MGRELGAVVGGTKTMFRNLMGLVLPVWSGRLAEVGGILG
jgi:hypothetical protein